MTKTQIPCGVAVVISWLGLAACASQESDHVTAESPAAEAPASVAEREAAVNRDPLKDAYFGELQLRTACSLDAYIFGNTMNDPFTAYRFAKGVAEYPPVQGGASFHRPNVVEEFINKAKQ